MTRKNQNQEYTHSPWSGKAYAHPPTGDELAAESMSVLQRHPAISKALRPDAMAAFIEGYKAKAGMTSKR